jgi:hypothetical protein
MSARSSQHRRPGLPSSRRPGHWWKRDDNAAVHASRPCAERPVTPHKDRRVEIRKPALRAIRQPSHFPSWGGHGCGLQRSHEIGDVPTHGVQKGESGLAPLSSLHGSRALLLSRRRSRSSLHKRLSMVGSEYEPATWQLTTVRPYLRAADSTGWTSRRLLHPQGELWSTVPDGRTLTASSLHRRRRRRPLR